LIGPLAMLRDEAFESELTGLAEEVRTGSVVAVRYP
jgi:hypothetical protein